MKNLEEMTRKELAEIIVDDQIRRGIVTPDKKEMLIQARLTGIIKMSKAELYKSAKYMLEIA
ncbi:MAG: hypothetical protein OSJ63_05570 [Bacilli bacterium]|nr:hypothetical protein [Bacilli bacterium]